MRQQMEMRRCLIVTQTKTIFCRLPGRFCLAGRQTRSNGAIESAAWLQLSPTTA